MSPPTSILSMGVEGLSGWPPPVLDPAGPYAGSVAALTWGLIGLFVAVLLVVLAALWIALFGRERLRSRLGGEKVIWIGGIAFPVIVLTGLLVWGLTLTRHLSEPATGPELRMRVSGEMWWWRVTYLDDAGRPVLHDANELHIPVGQTVAIELVSPDVVHSFWVPQLSGKLDMVPGRVNLIRIQADRPGIFAGQCAEYCGGPHALMGFTVIAHPREEYARWLARRVADPPSSATQAQARRGAELFIASGCGACHRIAGTPANGLGGPDLTFVGARRTLGAGILPNNRGTMMGWIADSQAIKPGNRMPPYRVLSADELEALAIYLEGQR